MVLLKRVLSTFGENPPSNLDDVANHIISNKKHKPTSPTVHGNLNHNKQLAIAEDLNFEDSEFMDSADIALR